MMSDHTEARDEDGRAQRNLAITRRLEEAEARQRREINDELERRSDAFSEEVDAVLSGEGNGDGVDE